MNFIIPILMLISLGSAELTATRIRLPRLRPNAPAMPAPAATRALRNVALNPLILNHAQLNRRRRLREEGRIRRREACVQLPTTIRDTTPAPAIPAPAAARAARAISYAVTGAVLDTEQLNRRRRATRNQVRVAMLPHIQPRARRAPQDAVCVRLPTTFLQVLQNFQFGDQNDSVETRDDYTVQDQFHDMKMCMRFCKNNRHDPLLANVLKQLPHKMRLHRKKR